MNTKYNFLEDFESICEYIENDKPKCRKVLDMFNAYVSSNENYNYNEMYLNGLINKFFNAIEIIKRKKEIVEAIWQYIRKTQENILEKYVIVVDDLFYLDLKNVYFLSIEQNNKITKINNTKLEKFNFSKINQTKMVVEYYAYKNLNTRSLVEILDINYKTNEEIISSSKILNGNILGESKDENEFNG